MKALDVTGVVVLLFLALLADTLLRRFENRHALVDLRRRLIADDLRRGVLANSRINGIAEAIERSSLILELEVAQSRRLGVPVQNVPVRALLLR